MFYALLTNLCRLLSRFALSCFLSCFNLFSQRYHCKRKIARSLLIRLQGARFIYSSCPDRFPTNIAGSAGFGNVYIEFSVQLNSKAGCFVAESAFGFPSPCCLSMNSGIENLFMYKTPPNPQDTLVPVLAG